MTSSDILEGISLAHHDLTEVNKLIRALPPSSTIVYTYGAWDLLHPGHVLFLARAKNLGDFLVCGVVSDEPIKSLKGKSRPIQTSEERLITTGSIRCVDAAIIQPDYDPTPHLLSLDRVDILVKGDDWEYIPGTETIEKLGGKLVKLGYTDGFSTSKQVGKITNID